MSLNNNTKRIFIAVRFFPDPVFFDMYRDIKSRLKNENIRWVKADNLHITLRYIGEYEISEIPRISEMLSEISLGTRDFPLVYKGIGVFRSLSYPKVLWAGLGKSEELEELKFRIDRSLNDMGFDFKQEKFSPHLTLGRMKHIQNKKELSNLIEAYRDKIFFRQNVESIVLIESRLSKSGAEYITISEHFFPDSEEKTIPPAP